jgi:predicted metal-binding membrane protein
MSQEFTAVEALLRRERLVVVAGLVLITALAWWWVSIGAGTGMSTLAMTTWQFPQPVRPTMFETWTPGYAIVMFFMWWIMTIAMMTPSANPPWSSFMGVLSGTSSARAS